MLDYTVRVKSNKLLKGADKKMSLREVMQLKTASEYLGNSASMQTNYPSLSNEFIESVHSYYGDWGLFRLNFLTVSQFNSAEEFELFCSFINRDMLLMNNRKKVDLICDHYSSDQSDEIAKFSLNFVQPSLSRKIYNPGIKPGYIAYGLGDPKILISHPFQNIRGEVYDIVNNSSKVVSALMDKGYRGTFLFLDYLPGLNYTIKDTPAWLAWFGIIASHSDLVIYIKVPEEGISDSQEKEMKITPNWIQKKTVEISAEDLDWAKSPFYYKFIPILHIIGNKSVTTEEFAEEEARHTKKLINERAKINLPQDRFYWQDEKGVTTELPLNYTLYH